MSHRAASRPSPPSGTPGVQALHDAFGRLAEQGRFRGVVRVDRGGLPLLEAAYGEDGAGRPIATGDAFQIASISKSFTAAGILGLISDGRLALDDELVAWIENAPQAWRGITLHHLLSHTSGLAHWDAIPELDLHAPCCPRELLARFAAVPSLFEPGRAWSYSSLGYVLLARVAEAAGGAPYPRLLTERVLDPLGLGQTGAVQARGGATPAAGSRQGHAMPSFELATVNAGTGDVWSTAGDLARWPRSLAATHGPEPMTRHATITGEDHGLTDLGYGYGWFVACHADRDVVFHRGDQTGFSSLLLWAPEPDTAIVVLAADELALAPIVHPLLGHLLSTEGSS